MAYKLKIGPSQSLKLKGNAGFALPMVGGPGLKATKTGGIWYITYDFGELSPGPILDATTATIAVRDASAGIYKEVSLSSLLTSGLDADLQAIAALTSAGVLVRTADDTWALRTITGTANEVTVTNGDGVLGNPTVSLPAALTFTGKTVTGGTFDSAVSYNKIAITAPATGATLTIADGKTLTVSNDATVSGTNTGDQTITLTGDVTGSGTGSFAATIGATKVTSAMLNADVFSTAHSWSGVQTFTDPIVGTQTAGDNSTKAASTAFVTAAVVASGGGDMLSTNNLSDVADAGTSMRNLGGVDVSAVVSVTTTTTLTSSAFGKLHLISGTAANYTVTLPTPVGNTGAIIALSVDNSTNATRLYTISSPSGNVGRDTSLVMWSHEQLVIRSDGTDWVIVSARQIPFVGTLTRTTNQTSSTGTNIDFTAAEADPTGLNLAFDAVNGNFKAPRAGVYKFDVYAYQTQTGGSYSQIALNAAAPFSYTGTLAAGTVYGTKAITLAASATVEALSKMDGTSPLVAAGTVGASLSYSEVVPSW